MDQGLNVPGINNCLLIYSMNFCLILYNVSCIINAGYYTLNVLKQ